MSNVARVLHCGPCMIGKTTAADNALAQSIRSVGSRENSSHGFARALAQQRQRLDGSVDGAARASAAPPQTTGRTPIGHGGQQGAPEATGRTPVGSRADAAASGREAVTPDGSKPTGARPNLSTADVVVNTTGALSEEARTEGMYVPPDFYHGNSYSPVFDQTDESGAAVRTPRFEGQVVYSDWRGSLPEDFDPNARVLRDPQAFENSPAYWKKGEDGTWIKRETGYGGIPLYDNGKPVYTPDPILYPEYFKT